MDLLLHLVRQSEVDVHAIRVAPILDDFLKHLAVLRALDLHDIGDFLVMASTLMEIKSRELLPNETVELEEEFDPRDDLIRRLLEYKRYRDLARELDGRARQSPLVLSQPAHLAEQADEDHLELGEVGIWELTSAFAKLLEEIGQQATMQIEKEKRDVGFYTRRLLDQFKARREVRFAEIFDRNEGRYGLIGTLIALLEMMKQGYLRAIQEQCFGEIHLAYKGGDDVQADQILAGIVADELKQRERDEALAAGRDPEDGSIPTEQMRAIVDADDDEGGDEDAPLLADVEDLGEDDVDEEPTQAPDDGLAADELA
jgi:segregation and condensation protein A